jgi:transcriptional regulator with XRE-family HTH domain
LRFGFDMAEVVRGGAPHFVDVHVGGRVRALRKHAKLSLCALAERAGVTYQQLQKYETGANRISSSTAFALAQALEVAVASFYEGLPSPGGGGGASSVSRLDAVLGSSAGRDLIEAFLAMPHPLRRQLAALAKGIVDPAEPAPALRRPAVPWGAANG